MRVDISELYFFQWNFKRWTFWRMELEQRRLTGSFSIQDSIQSLTSSLGSHSCTGTVTNAIIVSFPYVCCQFFLLALFWRVSFWNWGQSTICLEFDTARSWLCWVLTISKFFADQPSLNSQGWLMIVSLRKVEIFCTLVTFEQIYLQSALFCNY